MRPDAKRRSRQHSLRYDERADDVRFERAPNSIDGRATRRPVILAPDAWYCSHLLIAASKMTRLRICKSGAEILEAKNHAGQYPFGANGGGNFRRDYCGFAGSRPHRLTTTSVALMCLRHLAGGKRVAEPCRRYRRG